MDEKATERAHLRRLWAGTMPLAAPLAVGGCTYLQGLGIPAETASAVRVRISYLWGDEDDYQGAALVFPLQDGAGKLVAAEGRFLTPPGGVAPSYRVGARADGVFEALPGALDAELVVLMEASLEALAVAACGYPALALCGSPPQEWLAERLAGRDVLVGMDWHELSAENRAALVFRKLAAAGAKPRRLVVAAGRGWTERLRAVGLERMRAELDGNIVAVLESGA
jgi:hypothetical protein